MEVYTNYRKYVIMKVVIFYYKYMEHKHQQFSVIYQESREGVIATVPALPGCHTQAKTLKLAEKRIKEAIEVYIESFIEEKKVIPKQKSQIFLSSVMVSA
jgi:predicted RNase H-like HicB family nuclease